MKWWLSFRCLECGHEGAEECHDIDEDMWSREIGDGVIFENCYSCDKCSGERFMQWMTPDGLLRVDHGEKIG